MSNNTEQGADEHNAPNQPNIAGFGKIDVTTPNGMIQFMGLLMQSVITQDVRPGEANAACNAADKIIRVAKLYQNKELRGRDTFL